MSLPVGTIVGMIGVNPKSPPAGWLYCDGSSFSGTEYPDLAEILSNNKLPNLVGLTMFGASTNGGAYPASSLGYTQGSGQNQDGTYGNTQHTLSQTEMPSHQHFGFGEGYSGFALGQIGDKHYQGSKGGMDTDNYYYGTTFTGGVQSNTTTQSTNNAFSLFQPSFAIYFFICAGSNNSASLKTQRSAHV